MILIPRMFKRNVEFSKNRLKKRSSYSPRDVFTGTIGSNDSRKGYSVSVCQDESMARLLENAFSRIHDSTRKTTITFLEVVMTLRVAFSDNTSMKQCSL